jgi:hypothetical protein
MDRASWRVSQRRGRGQRLHFVPQRAGSLSHSPFLHSNIISLSLSLSLSIFAFFAATPQRLEIAFATPLGFRDTRRTAPDSYEGELATAESDVAANASASASAWAATPRRRFCFGAATAPAGPARRRGTAAKSDGASARGCTAAVRPRLSTPCFFAAKPEGRRAPLNALERCVCAAAYAKLCRV